MSHRVSEKTKSKWKKQIKFLSTYDSKLSEWEIGIVVIVSEQIEKGKELSFKQSSCLNRIFEKVQGEIG